MTRQQQRNFELGDYNDVASRIAEFREKHPDGRLRPVNPDQPYKVETIGQETFIVYTAAAYRSADDPLPGIGVAQEGYPGKTSYTRGSELQNAETSAWGRAIVAALAADTKKGIASAEEVRNRQAEREQWDDAKPAKPSREEELAKARAAIGRVTAPDQFDAIRKVINQRVDEGVFTQDDADELGLAMIARSETWTEPAQGELVAVAQRGVHRDPN